MLLSRESSALNDEGWDREDVAELLAIGKTAVRRALLTDEQLEAERARKRKR